MYRTDGGGSGTYVAATYAICVISVMYQVHPDQVAEAKSKSFSEFDIENILAFLHIVLLPVGW